MAAEFARKLEVLNTERKKAGTETKKITDQITEIEDGLIKLLLQNNITWIDTQINGLNKGPWYVLEKMEGAGTANKEREIRFFQMLGEKLMKGDQDVNSAYKMYKLRKQYFKKFTKRKLVLKKTERLIDFHDKEYLEKWLLGEE